MFRLLCLVLVVFAIVWTVTYGMSMVGTPKRRKNEVAQVDSPLLSPMSRIIEASKKAKLQVGDLEKVWVGF